MRNVPSLDWEIYRVQQRYIFVRSKLILPTVSHLPVFIVTSISHSTMAKVALCTKQWAGGPSKVQGLGHRIILNAVVCTKLCLIQLLQARASWCNRCPWPDISKSRMSRI